MRTLVESLRRLYKNGRVKKEKIESMELQEKEKEYIMGENNAGNN